MKSLIIEYLKKNWNADQAEKIQFSPVPKEQEGDLALSFFELAKEIKKAPIQIAQEVEGVLQKNNTIIEKTNISGPYLNLFFQNDVFFEQVLESSVDFVTQKNKTIVIEFSGPNTNKPLHLGHMRNHALGIAMSNLYEALGANVKRVNIINDRGVHICKSMLAYQKFGNGDTPEKQQLKTDHFVGQYYVRYEQEFKKDPNLKDEIQTMLVAWEEGDKDVRAIWKKMNDWTLSGHQKTYERQGIAFEKSYYESDWYRKGSEIAQQGLKKDIFQKRSDGAITIDLIDEGLDEKVVLRADGTSIYLTQDLAVASQREKDFHPDQMIYVVADEQNYHFKVLFACLDRLQLLAREKLYHLGYGLVHLPEGRMKSREGTVVDADNLMDELSALALVEIQSRNPDLEESVQKQIAEQIMNAAWKFYLLSTSPRKSITFDPKKSIAFEGATGPYLQYAGVRIRSILAKSNINLGKTKPNSSVLGDAEKPLGAKILAFEDTLQQALESKNPTYLVTYLLELAQLWSSYYSANSILKADTEELKIARLYFAQKMYSILEKGLGILGIEIPEKM